MKKHNKNTQVYSYIKMEESEGIGFITNNKSDVCVHEKRRAFSRHKKDVFKVQEGRVLGCRRASS